MIARVGKLKRPDLELGIEILDDDGEVHCELEILVRGVDVPGQSYGATEFALAHSLVEVLNASERFRTATAAELARV